MTGLARLSSAIVALITAIFLTMAVTGAMAQSARTLDPSPWQAVITGQLEALRQGDGEGALTFAGHDFRDNFDNGADFYQMILRGGYEPLVNSQSHTFGNFVLRDADHAAQEINFIGSDRALYRAVYEMEQEGEGWRVLGVAIEKRGGISV